MRRLLPLFFACSLGWAAVDGTVVNRTTGKPQPGATVTLYKLGGAGMESIESVKSGARGEFHIGQTPEGPHLLQAAFDGVTYNHMLPPGSPTAGLTLEVFNASKKPGEAKVAQHMILLEPAGDRLAVTENIIFRNDGKLSYNDPDNGTLRVWVPATTEGRVRVTASAPNGMPIQRAAEKTRQSNVYKIDFPVKPGETRFDINYALPFTSPGSFTGRNLENSAPLRLVVPPGVSLKGEGLTSLGQEPQTQAAIYEFKGKEYKVEIEGAGALPPASEASADEESGPSIEQVLPKIYERVYWILGLALAILAAGFILMYRRTVEPVTSAQPPRQATPRKGARRA